MPRLKQKLNFTLKFFGSTDDFKIPAVLDKKIENMVLQKTTQRNIL